VNQGVWLAGSWNGVVVEDQFQGVMAVAVVMFKEVRQRLAFLAGDEGQEDVAGQCQIERGVGFAMAMTVSPVAGC
jgi:hypothetical protein